MNLQVSIPYQPCIFNCPFCIARNHLHGNNFENKWITDKLDFLTSYMNTIEKYRINSVILTGECDPTQNMEFLEDIILMTKPGISIEIQTKNYKADLSDLDVDVIAYSVSTRKEYDLAKYFAIDYKNKTVRATIILSKNFNLDGLDFIGFDQVTFKTLQFGEDSKVNQWIIENNFNDYDKLYQIIKENTSPCSIRVDTNCMDSIGRYLIFRCDGQVYRFWSDLAPIQRDEELVNDTERNIQMKTYTLNKDYEVKWFGVIKEGTQIEVLDDNTPLNNSWRCRIVGDERIFGIKKATLIGVTSHIS